jgi:purine nucleoside phosphorylase
MTELYDRDLREAAFQVDAGSVREAVVLVRRGPCGPTAAEFRAYGRIGAEVVAEGGASEALAARHAGLRCGALLLVLQRDGEVPDPGQLATRADVGLPALGRVLGAMMQAPDVEAPPPATGDPR